MRECAVNQTQHETIFFSPNFIERKVYMYIEHNFKFSTVRIVKLA